MTPGLEAARASRCVSGARTRHAAAERKLLRSRSEAERLVGAVASRQERAEAQIAIEDAETALELAKADVLKAEAEERRVRDHQAADRLEKLGQELSEAAAGIDEAMKALVARFEAHRKVMLAIAKLDSTLGRAVAAPHLRRLIARSASQHHGLEKHLPVDGHRVVSHAEASFASATCPELEAAVRQLRGEGPEAESEAA